jgi:hypothetical protein
LAQGVEMLSDTKLCLLGLILTVGD